MPEFAIDNKNMHDANNAAIIWQSTLYTLKQKILSQVCDFRML